MRRYVIGTVGTLVLCLAVASFLEWRSPAEDDVARSVSGAQPVQSNEAARPKPDVTNATSATSDAAADPALVGQALEPVTFLDLSRRGGVEFDKGDFLAARARYQQALDKKPDDPDLLNHLGLTLERLDRLDEAIARFARAVEIAPDKWAYHFNLAHAFDRQQRWDRALGEYRRAAALFPTDYATQFNLAMVLQKRGNDQAAIPEFEKAIQLAPGEASFHASLGVSLERVGRAADAQREYQLYLTRAPDAPDAEKLKAHIQALTAAPPPPPTKTASVP